jgi:hypothetical protein
MPNQDLLAVDDRELRLVVTSLQRLALRVESRFNPDISEGADTDDHADDNELVDYARRCLEVLDDPAVIARLLAGRRSRW